MKTAAHQYEDKLLEFAYGELPSHEARAVDAHVQGCARCAAALADIRSVRSTMRQLPLEEAPEAGLASLLAMAEQQAKRNRAAAPLPWWRRLARGPVVASLSSVAALAVVGVVAWEASRNSPTTAEVALEAKVRQVEQGEVPPPASSPARAPASATESMAQAPAPPEKGPAAGYAMGSSLEASPPGRGAALSRDKLEVKKGIDPDEVRKKDVVKRLEERRAEPAPAGASKQALAQEAQRTDDGLEAPGAIGGLGDERKALTEVPASSKASLGLGTGKPQAAKKRAAPKGEAASELEAAVSREDAQVKSKEGSGDATASVRAARAAGAKSDAGAEAKFALEALDRGAIGADRLEMLKRLCDAFERLGDYQRADPYCDRVLTEFPKSAPAKQIASRRRNVQMNSAEVDRSDEKATTPAAASPASSEPTKN